jgi:HSP20 family protein
LAGRKRPSIFDMFNDIFRESPFLGRGAGFESDWFKDPFEDLIRRCEEGGIEGCENMIQEEETPSGRTRRYGPFVYGFSYTAEPGKEPVLREFGNVKPSQSGSLEPSQGREPLVDVMDEQDHYKIFVELPGVDKDKIKLDVADSSVRVRTEDQKNFYRMIDLDSDVNPDSTKASYKNGVLTIDVEKMSKRAGKEVSIE